MVRVCEDWFPKTNGFYMDEKLKSQLDIALKNVVHDWDFTIIIAGGGEVRVGKSVLAMQIGAYWSYQMEKVHKIKVPFTLKKNFVFDWANLIQEGNKLGKDYKCATLIYDEAGETMEGTKTMTEGTKAIKDFLRECGQYNFLNILVLPEFFYLPKGIALTRSTFLIDVYYVATEEGLFRRGYLKFYSRRQKKKLYLKGKKELDYKAAPYNFDGRFYNFYPVNEEEYRRKKREALRAREATTKDRNKILLEGALYYLHHVLKIKQKEIIKILLQLTKVDLPHQTVSRYIEQISLGNEAEIPIPKPNHIILTV